MTETRHVVVLPDAAAVAEAAAEMLVVHAAAAAAARNRFTVALAGGATPREMYRLLATPAFRNRTPWDRTEVFFGDERCVPPDHADSNYRMARETLLEPVDVDGARVHRIRGEEDNPTRAALFYERELREIFTGLAPPRLDLVLLGLGADGHTASLFPGTDALEENEQWVAANWVPKLGSWRVTLTLPVLRAARCVLFLVNGRAKARAFAEAFGGLPHPAPHPAERVVPRAGIVEVLADREAASLLPSA